MQIKGTATVSASKEVVWQMINDPEVLARITPGITGLERKTGDNFRAISDIRIGPVRGRFEGDLSITDKQKHSHMKVTLDQKSKIGNAVATIDIHLKETDDGKTTIEYVGDSRMSGMLARMGQRIIGGVISTLSKQFFKELENEIHKTQKK